MEQNVPANESNWEIQRRADGALLVRIRSAVYRGVRLPDAVFSFRAGDPQYELWEARLQALQNGDAARAS
jgi:hypothetical protein